MITSIDNIIGPYLGEIDPMDDEDGVIDEYFQTIEQLKNIF